MYKRQGVKRMPLIDVQADVAGRVDLQRDLAVAQRNEQRRILDGAHAVADPVGLQRICLLYTSRCV